MKSPCEDTLLRHLAGMLKPKGVTVESAVLEGRTRIYSCHGPDSIQWSVWLSPSASQSGAFQRGESFLLGYRGNPPPAMLTALEGLSVRLRALERATSPEGWFPEPERAAKVLEPTLIYGQTRLEMRVTLRCNERCLFCNSSEIAENQVTSREEALELLDRAREQGADLLVLTGGEPLLVEWLPTAALRARELGYRRITIQTNGVLLAREDIWERLQKAGPDELLISVHGPNDRVVESVSGLPGLLEPKQQAVVASVQAGYRVAISFVLCRQNMTHAAATMEMLARLAAQPKLVAFSYVAPSGAAASAGKETIPPMTEAAPHLLAGLQRASELGLEPVLVEYCGLPTCIEPALRDFSEPFDSNFPLGLPPDKRKLPICQTCYWDHRCSGIFKGYLDLYGSDEIVNAPASHRQEP